MRAALGIRVHSGWAVAIAAALPDGRPHVLDRRRIICIDASTPGSKQPYHFVERMSLEAAQRHLDQCAAVSKELAAAALREITTPVVAAVILDAAGRPLPDLAGILKSHALIHTAEGEFFRAIFRHACETLRIPVIRMRERALAAAPLRDKVNDLGRTLGPPWTQDEKLAALAACLALSGSKAAAL